MHINVATCWYVLEFCEIFKALIVKKYNLLEKHVRE